MSAQFLVVLNTFHSCFAEIRGFLILNPTPIPSPLIPPLVLPPRHIIPEFPHHPRHPANVPGAVAFVLHPRKKIILEQIHIGGDSDEILTQVRKNGHGRHCIWREIEEVESVDGHDRLKEFREATDKVSTKESI